MSAAKPLTPAQVKALRDSVESHERWGQHKSANCKLRHYSMLPATIAALEAAGMVERTLRFTEHEREIKTAQRDALIKQAGYTYQPDAAQYYGDWKQALECLEAAGKLDDELLYKDYILTPAGLEVGRTTA